MDNRVDYAIPEAHPIANRLDLEVLDGSLPNGTEQRYDIETRTGVTDGTGTGVNLLNPADFRPSPRVSSRPLSRQCALPINC